MSSKSAATHTGDAFQDGVGAASVAWDVVNVGLTAYGAQGLATAGVGAARSAAAGRGGPAVSAGATLPALKGTFAESFAGSTYSAVTFEAGQVFYRAEAAAATAPGSFLGLQKPLTAAAAEELYNLSKWANRAEVVRTYTLTTKTTVYYGEVAGGVGTQAFIPRGINPSEILKLMAEEELR